MNTAKEIVNINGQESVRVFKKLLTEEQEQECWLMFTEQKLTRREIAEQLGVSRDTVSRALNNYNHREQEQDG